MFRPSISYIGKSIRLSRIFNDDGKAVVFAMDHGFEHGPIDFPGETVNPRFILSKVVEANVDAVMVTRGIAMLTWDILRDRAGLIVKVTGKTSLRPSSEQLTQSIISAAEDAVVLGADGVAATVYWGSPYEDLMLQRFTEIVNVCEAYGLPVLQLAYPRGPTIKDRYDPEVVRYATRAAVESGADIVKTHYTGSRESFSEVVKAASGIPVLMSGGPKTDSILEFLEVVEDVMAAGARGVVVGRNIFQSRDPVAAAKAIMMVVHEGLAAEEAAKAVKG